MTDNERESIVERIRKLSKFTVANGCSEHEAAAAMRKVAELIAAHNVTQSELDVRREAARCLRDEFIELNSKASDYLHCVVGISRMYGTRTWYGHRDEDTLGIGMTMRVTYCAFFGLASDVAACIATTSIIHTAIEGEAAKYKGRASARASFRAGMVARLNERLAEMARVPAPSTGNALVVLKNQLVTEEWAKLNMRLGRGTLSNVAVRDGAAFNAGRSAAGRVDLGGAKVGGTRSIGYK